MNLQMSAAPRIFSLQARGTYIDRPTISYTPITGQPLVDLLLRPTPPATIFAIVDANYPAVFVMERAVSSLNDLHNYSLAPSCGRPEDRRFHEVIAAIGRLQLAGAIAARTASGDGKSSGTTLRRESEDEKGGNKPLVTTLYFRRHVSAAAERDIHLVKSLLGLDPKRDEFRVTGGPRHTPQEIAVTARSLQEMIAELAAGVDVPPQDVAEGRATSVPEIAESPNSPPLIHIHSGAEPPYDAYSEVYYQNL